MRSIQKIPVKGEERTDLLPYRSSVARVAFDGLICGFVLPFCSLMLRLYFSFLKSPIQ